MRIIFTLLLFTVCFSTLFAQEYIDKRKNGFDFSIKAEVGDPILNSAFLKYGINNNKFGIGFHKTETDAIGPILSYDRLLLSNRRFDCIAYTQYRYKQSKSSKSGDNTIYRGHTLKVGYGVSLYVSKRIYIQSACGVGYTFSNLYSWDGISFSIDLGLGILLSDLK